MNRATQHRHRTLVTASALALVLAACGGGGGGGSTAAVTPEVVTPPESGSGGTTTEAPERSLSGSIDGFGSVFVGGVRFETDDAEIIINGEPGSEDDLDLGMVVQLQGTINEDGSTGTASRIVYNNELTGPIESISDSADQDARELVILGFNVIVDGTTTFDDVTFDTLAVGDVVEVSGFPEEGNRLRATFVEREDDFEPDSTEVEITGIARNVTASAFSIGEITVDTSVARIDEEDGALADGVRVKVEGTLADRVLTATEVETREGTAGGLQDGDPVTIQGTINGYRDDSDFRIRDVAVDGGSATLSPASLALGNGRVVQVDGSWSSERGVVVAERILSRRGRIEVEGPFEGPGAEDGTIVLSLAAGAVTVTVNSATRLEDDREPELPSLSIGDLATGDFLEVEAYLDGDTLVATSIDRDEVDEQVVQAPVESFEEGVSITLLGLSYSLDGGTDYENIQDNDIPATAFFAQLQAGDLIKVSDGDDDEPADAFADEVEVEDVGRQDGGREFGCGFEDDDSSCDDDDLLGDDTRSDDDDDLVEEDDDSADDDVTDGDDGDVDDDTLGDDDLTAGDDDLTAGDDELSEDDEDTAEDDDTVSDDDADVSGSGV